MNFFKNGLLGVSLLILTAFFFSHAWAADSQTAPTSRPDYGAGVGKKLGRGISNVAFGWLELPKSVEDVGEENNFIAALTWGPIRGIGMAAQRTLAGAYEVATFAVPVPKDFEPVLEPEFALGDKW